MISRTAFAYAWAALGSEEEHGMVTARSPEMRVFSRVVIFLAALAPIFIWLAFAGIVVINIDQKVYFSSLPPQHPLNEIALAVRCVTPWAALLILAQCLRMRKSGLYGLFAVLIATIFAVRAINTQLAGFDPKVMPVIDAAIIGPLVLCIALAWLFRKQFDRVW
jgi:hypothetical protein